MLELYEICTNYRPHYIANCSPVGLEVGRDSARSSTLITVVIF